MNKLNETFQKHLGLLYKKLYEQESTTYIDDARAELEQFIEDNFVSKLVNDPDSLKKAIEETKNKLMSLITEISDHPSGSNETVEDFWYEISEKVGLIVEGVFKKYSKYPNKNLSDFLGNLYSFSIEKEIREFTLKLLKSKNKSLVGKSESDIDEILTLVTKGSCIGILIIDIVDYLELVNDELDNGDEISFSAE